MDINHLKSLVAAAKSSDHMYEQQTAAMVFATVYGEQLIAALIAAQGMRESLGIVRYATLRGDRAYLQADVGDNKLAVMSIDAWDAATKGEES